jgi:hypothetical protein
MNDLVECRRFFCHEGIRFWDLKPRGNLISEIIVPFRMPPVSKSFSEMQHVTGDPGRKSLEDSAQSAIRMAHTSTLLPDVPDDRLSPTPFDRGWRSSSGWAT